MAENSAQPPPRLKYRLSAQDAGFLYGESTSAPLHIGTILIFDGHLPFAEMLNTFAARIHLVPRYRQRLAEVPLNLAHAGFEDDPDFRLENHVIRHQLRPGTSQAAAMDAVFEAYEPPLNRGRPLWEMHSFEGIEGGRTWIVSKVHHCMVDGVSGVELLKVMLDFRPDPPPTPTEPFAPPPLSSPLDRLARAARDMMHESTTSVSRLATAMMNNRPSFSWQTRMALEASRTLFDLASRPLVAAPWNAGLCTQKRRLAYCRMGFADFRLIRTVFGGSVNDVVLAILSEGAARYLREHGVNARGARLCLGCPVNVRHGQERTALGNRVSMMFPAFSAEPMEIVERLNQVRAETERVKGAHSAQALESLMALSDAIPPALIAAGGRLATLGLDAAAAVARITDLVPARLRPPVPARGINFIATNVPGVLVPQFLLGRQCLEQVPLVPLGGSLGYGVAILSYNTSLNFGLMSEPRLMPDVERMKGHVDGAFSELLSRARAAAAHAAELREPASAAAT